MDDGGGYRHFIGCNSFIFILAMNIANKIKRETIPLSVERGVMAAGYCIKWKLIEWDCVWCCEYTFIDGSTIVHRCYCDGLSSAESRRRAFVNWAEMKRK